MNDIIDETSSQHAKAMLQALACSDPKIRKQIHQGLGMLEEHFPLSYKNTDLCEDDTTASSADDDDDEEGEEITSSVSNKKRKREEKTTCSDRSPVLDICRRPNCRAVFIPGEDEDNETNTEESCQFHPGELKLNEASDAWDGWIYEHDGAMDCAESRETNPLGFIYDCCDETGEEEEGCTFDRHLPSRVHNATGLKKQRRM